MKKIINENQNIFDYRPITKINEYGIGAGTSNLLNEKLENYISPKNIKEYIQRYNDKEHQKFSSTYSEPDIEKETTCMITRLSEENESLKMQIDFLKKDQEESIDKYMNMCFELEFKGKEEFELSQKEKEIYFNQLQEAIKDKAKNEFRMNQLEQELKHSKDEIKYLEENNIIKEVTDNSIFNPDERKTALEEIEMLKTKIDTLQDQISSFTREKVK